MCEMPVWLPSITIATGIWENDLKNLYETYSNYFVDSECFLDGAKVFTERRMSDGEYPDFFWHLVTKDFADAKQRLIDPRRAERLVWSRPLIENSDDAEVTKFSSIHTNGKVRTYLWLEDLDYVLILQPFPNGKATQLITAYYVEGDSTRRKLRRTYEDRIK